MMRSVAEIQEFLKWQEKNLSPAVQEAVRQWVRDELPSRFQFGNTQKMGWAPNTQRYEMTKMKKYGQRLPQLVAEGTLRDTVLGSIKVNYQGMTVSYPIYGKNLIAKGLDFTHFRKEDLDKITELTKEILMKKM